MEDIHSDREDLIKDYVRCLKCKVFITFRSNLVDQFAEDIPLDLNLKRHICSNADCIIHEQRIVKEVEYHVDKVNQVELTSFQLRLEME